MTETILYSGSVQLGIAQSQVIFSSGDPVAVISDRGSVEQSTSLKGTLYHTRIYNFIIHPIELSNYIELNGAVV
jgi:hypothetical protein